MRDVADTTMGQLEELWKRVERLDPRWKLAIMGAAAVAAVAGGVLWFTSIERPDATLFSNLEPDDASRIAGRLEAMGVVYELTDGGGTVRVPSDQVHETRLTLATEGLPGGGAVGFELFDEQRFGESDFSEQVKYRRALEGELARTIGHLAGVERARVHLVLPTRTLFAEDEGQGSASVVLHLRPGWRMREDQSRGIAHLVASSIQGLAIEKVTLVDGEGRRLHDGGDEERLSGDAVEFRRGLEQSKERAVQQLLDAMLGAGHSVVRVSADVDFSREERTEESYDPESVATRSLDVLEEADGAAGPQAAAGVPGVASNLPGGETPPASLAERGLSRRRETRNYEVSKVVRRNVEPVGRLKKLHAAIVVDGTWKGEGDDREFVPRDAEELEQIEALATSALGLDDERGDELTVASMPFAVEEVEAPELPPGPDELLAPYMPWLPLAEKVGLGLAGAIAFLMFWRQAKKATARMLEPRPKALGGGPPATGGDAISRANAIAEEFGAGSGVRMAKLESPATAEELEETRRLVIDLVMREPETAARIVRFWLKQGDETEG